MSMKYFIVSRAGPLADLAIVACAIFAKFQGKILVLSRNPEKILMVFVSARLILHLRIVRWV